MSVKKIFKSEDNKNVLSVHENKESKEIIILVSDIDNSNMKSLAFSIDDIKHLIVEFENKIEILGGYNG